MKPKLLHNLKDLTYEDSLLDTWNSWTEPPICPTCGDDQTLCGCRYAAPKSMDRLTQEQRSWLEQEALKIIHKANPSLTSPNTSATI